MTPQDHNKVLGIMHLIYGGFFALVTLLMLVFTVFIWGALGAMPSNPNDPPPALIGGFMAIFVVIYGILSVPSLIAGFGLLKRRQWGRIAGIVAAFLSAISFPFGTALCVYTLWFLFSHEGQNFYEGRQVGYESPQQQQQQWRGSLHDAPPQGWDARSSTYGRQHEYVPPPQPPNWRDES